MKASEITTLFDYNYWATARILQTADRLEPEQFVVAPHDHTSDLRSILVHMLSVERLWRIRLETAITPERLRTEDFPTIATLQQRWGEEQHAMRAYLATLDEDMLEGSIQFQRAGKLAPPFVRWHLLLQCLTHGVAHRSEAAALLTAYGQSPGDLDFFFYVLEQGNG
jgi:uncharacterized damage-inducible protein DinB